MIQTREKLFRRILDTAIQCDALFTFPREISTFLHRGIKRFEYGTRTRKLVKSLPRRQIFLTQVMKVLRIIRSIARINYEIRINKTWKEDEWRLINVLKYLHFCT
ncbi:hypothetical protein ACROYT_G029489 [Oculina patagonica]